MRERIFLFYDIMLDKSSLVVINEFYKVFKMLLIIYVEKIYFVIWLLMFCKLYLKVLSKRV